MGVLVHVLGRGSYLAAFLQQDAQRRGERGASLRVVGAQRRQQGPGEGHGLLVGGRPGQQPQDTELDGQDDAPALSELLQGFEQGPQLAVRTP